jgi:hypothetical protein
VTIDELFDGLARQLGIERRLSLQQDAEVPVVGVW